MLFDQVQAGPVDPMHLLKAAVQGDKNTDKVDLGVGVYRNEAGKYHELGVLKRAKEYNAATNPPHDYGVATGMPEYVQAAATVVFGKDSSVLNTGKLSSVQTLSGTGAVHLGALFLKHSISNLSPRVYIGLPAWGNYQPLFHLQGYEVHTYQYYNPSTQQINFDAALEAIRAAPQRSVFVFQGCCHNPVAIDYSDDQWQILAREIRAYNHIPFFDIAYQGLGRGLDADGFAVRHFAESGELLVAQSFSKNFGLYGERVGALHTVTSSAEVAANVKDRMRSLIRWQYSSPPAYGSRLVTRVLSDSELEAEWRQELEEIRSRLQQNRHELHRLLVDEYKTPGNWDLILQSKGLFCLLPLAKHHAQALQKKHIYLLTSGRINLSGLNPSNFDRVAAAIDSVVRNGEIAAES